MEISGKILREVEFRDRLRGYDTDEVDEFLEKVALGIDGLHEEITAANVRAERAEKQFETIPPVDDDSIRRTLVLAQRTADLAISEAREEATRLLEQARAQSDSLLADARQSAQTMRNDAERDLQARVLHLGEEHDRLTRQIEVLSSLVEGERARISESLSSLLGYVAEALSVAPALSEAAQLPGLEPTEANRERSSSYLDDHSYDHSYERPPEPSGRAAEERFDRTFPRDDDPLELGLPDVEAEIGEDAAIAFGAGSRELGSEPSTPAELDPDEELWSRWANSAESDEPRHDPAAEHFRFGRRGDGDQGA